MMRFVLEESPAVKRASLRIWRMRRTLTNASKHATGPLSQRTTNQKIVRARTCVRSVCVCVCVCLCVGVWVSVSMSCVFLYVCFCVCLLLWFGFISSGLQHCKSWLGPDREFEKVPLLRKRLPMPTVQNIHGDWLAFAGAGMPQRLALYSNCVPKPVPFSSKSPKHRNSSALQQFQRTGEINVIETLVSKNLFLSAAMGLRVINPGTQVKWIH